MKKGYTNIVQYFSNDTRCSRYSRNDTFADNVTNILNIVLSTFVVITVIKLPLRVGIAVMTTTYYLLIISTISFTRFR